MHPGSLRRLVAALAFSVGVGGLTVPVAGAAPAEKQVAYAGVTVSVPADWPVIDLDASDDVCVRLDVDAVYLGTAPEQQNCPSGAVGRGNTVWIGPTGADEQTATGRKGWSSPGARGTIRRNDQDKRSDVALQGRGVSVRTGWGPQGSAAVDAIVADMEISADPVPVPSRAPAQRRTTVPTPRQEPVPVGPKTAEERVAPASLSSLTAAVPVGQPLYGAMAFDACSAPSVTSMQAWRQSPYVAVGIYTSGSMRACPFQGGTSWINQVTAQGWGLIPIHVGPQSPCVQQANLAMISRNATTARAQGVTEAGIAVAAVQALGMGPGTLIELDMENYSMTDAECSAATVAHVSGWTQELHRLGYVSGVYGGPGSMMRDMSRAVAGDPSFVPPDQIWVAHWNQLQTTRDTYSPQFYPDVYWANHQRMRQYSGDTVETWGGVALHIDRNWADITLPGNPVRTDYGTNIVGPGSAGFVFTGSMTYWRPAAGSGVKQKAYWTGPSSTEFNGATWSPTLAPGTYRVEANVPDASVATRARYVLTSAGGTSETILDQSTASGYRLLGTVTVRTGQPASVHLADNSGGDTSKRIWADAIRFVSSTPPAVPGAPLGPTAVAGNGQATISWSPGTSGASPTTTYTVTASPGGSTVSVAAPTTTVTMTGLVNGTAYTFTVTASNAGGTGPASAATTAVMPGLAGGVTSVDPVRVLDTRFGAPANPGLVTAIPAGGNLRLRLVGAGSPVPSTATAVLANVTAVAGNSPGYLAVAGSPSSLVNWVSGAVVANLSTVPVATDGTVTLTNGGTSPVHVVLDVQGWIAPQVSTRLSPIAAVRLMDSRVGTSLNPRATALGPGESVEVKVSGSSVPAGAQAALLRVTATDPRAAGYLSVSPSGAGSTSVVNFLAGDTVGNTMVANLTSSGTVRLTNGSTGTTHVVVDVQGWTGPTAAQLYRATPQARLVDTRFGTTTNPGAAILGPGEVRTFRVAGAPGSPVPMGVSLLAVNVTITNGTRPGWVAIAASGTPGIPLVNYVANEARAGFGTVDVAADGTVRIRNESTGSVHVVLDVHGYGTTTP